MIGNPGSGNASAPELLPGFWRVAGQLLPPGAGGQALRTAAYFDGHALTQPLLVLAAWAAGAALAVRARAGARRTDAATRRAAARSARRRPDEPAPSRRRQRPVPRRSRPASSPA